MKIILLALRLQILQSQKSLPLAFHGFSKVVNVFLLLWFSYFGASGG